MTSTYIPHVRESKTPEMAPKRVEQVKYPISGLELYFYFAVWIAHSFIAIVLTYQASSQVGIWFNSALRKSPYHPDYIVDDSDTEWLLFRASFLVILKSYIIHAICFRLAQKIPCRSQESMFLIIVWTVIMIKVQSWPCFMICTAMAVVMTGLVAFFRIELIAWLGCIVFVLNSGPQFLPYSVQPDVYYREYQMYVYTAVKILNFCIYLCRNKEVPINPHLILRYIEYLLYPPFCSTLIVLFEDFKDQRHNQKPFNLKATIGLALRLAWWFFVVELALHFLRFNAFFNAPFTTMTNLHNYQVVSIAYLAGQYFHTKYVVIFGIARLFAQIDGITPPESAICISRVTKYSRMWRYFDRGLYQFLKNQLYVPFLGTGDMVTLIIRRFVAMIVVFGFVLCWHGLNANYGYWVLLSALELIIERVGLVFYNSNMGTKLRLYVGEAHFARLSAFCCISNVIPGIFGAFFFLDRKDNGLNIFNNVLVKGMTQIIRLDVHPYNEGFVMTHLLLLGYCFAHVCAFLHVKLDSRTRHLKKE